MTKTANDDTIKTDSRLFVLIKIFDFIKSVSLLELERLDLSWREIQWLDHVIKLFSYFTSVESNAST